MEINVLDTAAFLKIANVLGLVDVAQAILAGDLMGALQMFADNMISVYGEKLGALIGIVFMWSFTKKVTRSLTGGKSFSFFGIDIKIA